MNLIPIKCVIVGDGAVGKTCLLVSYTSNSFPSVYIPTVFENYTTCLKFDNKNISLTLYDTAGQEDYDRIRPLSYPSTDVFILCYSIISSSSFENIEGKWIEEIKQYSPETPFILVGTKSDFREEMIDDKHLKFVSENDGKELAMKIGAIGFLECSALTQYNLRNVFEEAVKCALEKKENDMKKLNKKKKRCIIF